MLQSQKDNQVTARLCFRSHTSASGHAAIEEFKAAVSNMFVGSQQVKWPHVEKEDTGDG